MSFPKALQDRFLVFEKTLKHFQLINTIWITASCLMISFVLVGCVYTLHNSESTNILLYLFLMAGLSVCTIPMLAYTRLRMVYCNSDEAYLENFHAVNILLISAEKAGSPSAIDTALSHASTVSRSNEFVYDLLIHRRPRLEKRIYHLKEKERESAIRKEIVAIAYANTQRLNRSFNNEPLVRQRDNHRTALSKVVTKLDFLRERRKLLAEQWDVQYEAFSWWNKLKYSEGPNYSDIDNAIRQLDNMRRQLNNGANADLSTLEVHYAELRELSGSRLAELQSNSNDLLRLSTLDDEVTMSTLQKSLWLSAMSVPVSVWLDVDSALDIYDTLRQVNQNYAELSADEIFVQTLFMPSESLEGLSALVKGAHFEQLVAADTGGELHEHFNNPGTDMVLDGVEYQLKATDSVSYIQSVDAGIPVIATSEVAATTTAIDSGYTDEELNYSIDLALGGAVIDVGDTAVDALLTGLGGLGFFATLEGINHASEKYQNGGDGVEAIFEGAGVAIEGTARSLVGAAEMGYNVLNSRPSRFIGRTIAKGAVKLDNKFKFSEI